MLSYNVSRGIFLSSSLSQVSTQIAYCLSERIGNELKEIQSEPSNTSMGIAVPEEGGGSGMRTR